MASQQSITPLQQMASSCTGALCTSLLMTPLDVVKTRLQAQSQVELPCSEKAAAALRQGRSGGSGAVAELAEVATAGCPKCSYFVLNNGLMEHAVPVAEAYAHCNSPTRRSSSVNAFAQAANCVRRAVLPQHGGRLRPDHA